MHVKTYLTQIPNSNGATISFPSSPINCAHSLQSNLFFLSILVEWQKYAPSVTADDSVCHYVTLRADAAQRVQKLFAPSINVSFLFHFSRIHKCKTKRSPDLVKVTRISSNNTSAEGLDGCVKAKSESLNGFWKWDREIIGSLTRCSWRVLPLFRTHRSGKGSACAVCSRLEKKKKSVCGHRERWEIHTGGVRLQILFPLQTVCSRLRWFTPSSFSAFSVCAVQLDSSNLQVLTDFFSLSVKVHSNATMESYSSGKS